MRIDKEKVIDIVSIVGYFAFAYLAIEFFSINKYDWMLEPGDSVCSIPHQSFSNRTLQAGIAALFLITPLLIALLRNLYIRDRYKTGYYATGILGVTLYGGWVFFGRLVVC
ncbi:DUF2645 family protein [Serratia oryzae]|jgi:hypothetical protein|uniref:DUF2645 domain-containing protein n=1 Tax=Serratia oryzae TaxID=2034155 RepID=A0A1S8CFG7_9GAMM|nr:DUF2645 family protein [Serratia oryzae]OMQ19571.1 DUF2645 domain-containing protein [Serratia oryzae]